MSIEYVCTCQQAVYNQRIVRTREKRGRVVKLLELLEFLVELFYVEEREHLMQGHTFAHVKYSHFLVRFYLCPPHSNTSTNANHLSSEHCCTVK